MNPAKLTQQFDSLRITSEPPPGFHSTTYAVQNVECLRKNWTESSKPIPVKELQAFLSSIAAIQAYNLNMGMRDLSVCSFATEIVKTIEAKAIEFDPKTYPYIIENLITLCLADPDSNMAVQNLFVALANQPVGAHLPPSVFVALCNGHQFFDFPQPARFSILRELVEPYCKDDQFASCDAPLSLNELLTIAIAFAKFRAKDGFLITLQALLKKRSDLSTVDTDKLTRLSVSLSRHPECDEAFVVDLLHILMNRPWSNKERKVNRILYSAASLSNPPRDIQERLCLHYEEIDEKLLKVNQLAALSRLPIQQEAKRKTEYCRLQAELHRQLMAIIQEHTVRLKDAVEEKSKDYQDTRVSYKVIRKIQDHFSNFRANDLKELIDCLISISKVDPSLRRYAEKQFLELCTKAHDFVQTTSLLTWLCKGHAHFRFSDPTGFSRLQGPIEYHCQNGQFSTENLLEITSAYASYGKCNGFLVVLQGYLQKRGDLSIQDHVHLTQAVKALSTHPERDEALIIVLLGPPIKIFETCTLERRLVVLNAVGRLAYPPPEFQETLCNYYFDGSGFSRSSLNEVALVSRLPLVQEDPHGKRLQRIKDMLHANLARCERASLAALIVAFSRAKVQDQHFLNALHHAICQEEEPVGDVCSLEDMPADMLFSMAKRHAQNNDAGSLRAVIEEFLRRQAQWKSLLWTKASGQQVSLKIEEEENILYAPLSAPRSSVLLGLCMRTIDLEEALQDLIDLLQNGRLAGRYPMPSDHLPIGAAFAGIKLMSWNVLNSAYMHFIKEGKCKALKVSLITHLDVRLKVPLKNEDKGLTNRDVRVAKMIVAAIRQGIDIFALQECSEHFLHALSGRLPQHFKIVKKCDYPVIDQEVFVYNSQRLLPRPDLNPKQQAFYTGTTDRKIFSFAFEIADASHKILRLFNAHVPGDPKIQGHEQFASHVAASSWPDEIVCAVGDYNYERQEVLEAFQRAKLQPIPIFPWDTNIGPDSKVKAIDHILVQGAMPVALKPDELLPNSYLLHRTIEFLNKKKLQSKPKC